MNPLVVLIVDGCPIVRQSVVRFVHEHAPDQIVVGGAISGSAEALALLTRLHPDVVLWGISVPALPRLQLLPQVRAMLPQAGILVLGVLEDEGYRQVALAAGADAFLPKDDLETALLPAIMHVAQARRAD